MKYGMTRHDKDGHAPWAAEDFEKAASGDRRRMSGSLTQQDRQHTCIESHQHAPMSAIWGTSRLRSGLDGPCLSIAEAEAPLALMTRSRRVLRMEQSAKQPPIWGIEPDSSALARMGRVHRGCAAHRTAINQLNSQPASRGKSIMADARARRQPLPRSDLWWQGASADLVCAQWPCWQSFFLSPSP